MTPAKFCSSRIIPTTFAWCVRVLSEMSSDPFDLIAVKSHTEAVARLAEDTIDVILLALALPEATGLEIPHPDARRCS